MLQALKTFVYQVFTRFDEIREIKNGIQEEQ
jgi:uncharacterized membrane protein YjfL (UPF0719 family)